ARRIRKRLQYKRRSPRKTMLFRRAARAKSGRSAGLLTGPAAQRRIAPFSGFPASAPAHPFNMQLRHSMTKASLWLLAELTLLACPASAQRVQNMDISWLVGPVFASNGTIPGSDLQVTRSTGFSNIVNYGYQMVRTPAGNLWVEFFP